MRYFHEGFEWKGVLVAPPPEGADPEVHLAWVTLMAYHAAHQALGADMPDWDRAVRAYIDLGNQPRRED